MIEPETPHTDTVVIYTFHVVVMAAFNIPRTFAAVGTFCKIFIASSRSTQRYHKCVFQSYLRGYNGLISFEQHSTQRGHWLANAATS